MHLGRMGEPVVNRGQSGCGIVSRFHIMQEPVQPMNNDPFRVLIGLLCYLALISPAVVTASDEEGGIQPFAVLIVAEDGTARLEPLPHVAEPPTVAATKLDEGRGLDLPDLVMVDAMGFCDEAAPMIRGRVENQGTAPAGPFAIGYYLSTDENITATDTRIGATTQGGLGAGSGTNYERFFGVELPPGEWYFGALVDDLGQVTEIDETNNALVAGNLTLPCLENPDLTVTSLTAFCNDGQIFLEGTLANIGAGDSGPFVTGIYASEDAVIGVGDLRIGTLPVHDLEAGEVNPFAGSVDTANVPDGLYYVGILLDDTFDVNEADETNNAMAGGQATLPCPGPRPDLWIPYLAAECEADGFFEVLGTVRNRGGSPTPPFEVGIYASTDDEIRTTDYRFLTIELPLGLPAGGELDFERELLDVDVPAGTWYIGAIADDRFEVDEWNETNNKRTDGREQLPCELPEADLFPRSLAARCTAPDEISIEGRIQNGGTSATGAFTVGVYLSNNEPITFLDTLIDSFTIPFLGSGQVVTYNRTIGVVDAVEPGTWWVGLIVDDGDVIPEYDETNNDLAGEQVVQPCLQPDVDLRISSLTIFCNSDDTVAVNGAVFNAGEQAAGPFTVGYYLSPDLNITTADTRLGFDVLGTGLLGGANRVLDRDFDLSGFSPGTWYLGVYADDRFDVDEASEVNNTLSRGPTTLPCGPQIEVVPAGLLFDFTTRGTTTRSASFQIRNLGAENLIGEIEVLGPEPWLELVSPTVFNVAPSTVRNIEVTVDGALAPPGVSDTILRVSSNAVNDAEVDVPITIRIPGQASATIGSSAGLVGDVVRVPISIADVDVPISSFQAEIDFDAGTLAFIDSETFGTLTQGWLVDENVSAPGTLEIGGIDTDTLDPAGVLIYLDFEILAGAGGSCTDLGLTSMVFGDGTLPVGSGDGEICVASCTQGDLDGSGTITAFDAQLALFTALGIPTAFDPIAPGCADANCDGMVTAFDAALILRVALSLDPGFCTRAPLTRGDSVTVSLPRTTAEATGSFLLPIRVTALDAGTDVVAWQGSLRFDPDLFAVTGVVETGSLSNGLTVAANTSVPGLVTLGGFDSNPMAGAGDLIFLEVVPLSPGETVPVWESFVFNDGVPGAVTASDAVRLFAPSFFDMIGSWPLDDIISLVEMVNHPGSAADDNPGYLDPR